MIIDDFDVSVVEKDLFKPIYDKLSFLGRGELRLIVAKEFVDLFRSGSIKKWLYPIQFLLQYCLEWLGLSISQKHQYRSIFCHTPLLGFDSIFTPG